MADVPAFQDHHIIERQAYRDSPLLKKLNSQGLFNIDDAANRLNMPSDRGTAGKMGVSPHSGGPLGSYSDALEEILSELERSPDGRLALQGDKPAAGRVAEQVNTLRNTMRAGLVNGDLFTNTPINMTAAETSAKINSFFRNLESYAKNHANQIDKVVRGQVNVWDAATVSETRVQAALDAIEQTGNKAAKGPAEAAKLGLGLAVAEARQTGRLVVSPTFAQKLDTVWDAKLLNDVLSGKAVVSSAHMATVFKGLKVLSAAGLIYDIGTSTAEAADASSKGDRAGAGNIMARLVGRLYLGMEGAVAGAAIGGAIGAPGGPVALASSLVFGLAGGIAGVAVGDAAVDALWKAADDIISLLQAGTPEAGVDTPLLQPSGKYYRGLIASGMPKEVADKLVRELNAEYKERRLEQPNASVESLIENVIRDVRANQAIEPEEEAGANVTIIRRAQYATTTISSDIGKVETINDIKTGKPVSSKLFDSQGRKAGDIRFNSNGSSVEKSYDPVTGTVTVSITKQADNSNLKQTFNSQGEVVRKQRYDASNNLIFDTTTSDDEAQRQLEIAVDKAWTTIRPYSPYAIVEWFRQKVSTGNALSKFENMRIAEAATEADAIKQDVAEQLAAATKAEAQKQAAAKVEADKQAAVKADAQNQTAAKVESQKQAAEMAEGDRQAAAKAETERRAAAKAEAERQAAAKAEAERQASAKAEAERQAAARAEADRRAAAEKAERDRIASEEARKAQELQLQRYNERLKQEEQSRRESQERQRQWDMQQQREAEQRRQQAAEQARRDAEREKLRRESENAVFENMRKQGTFSNLPSSSTIFGSPAIPVPQPRPGPVPTPRPIAPLPSRPIAPSPPPSRWRPVTGGRFVGVPVVLDLNNDGRLDLTTLPSIAESNGASPAFDWNGDDLRDRTAWIGPNEGMLVIDLGKNDAAWPDGQINRPEEIAFSLWKSEEQRVAELKEKGIDDTGRPVTDLEGLRFAFDSNQDNILDNRDARWSEFRIWQDFNQNGFSDEGELSTLEAEGITFIDLLPSEQGAKSFPDGSMITGTSSAKRIDGTSILVGDVALAYRPSQSRL